MNIEEFEKRFVKEDLVSLKKEALYRFVDDNAIFNALTRHGIRSIEDFYNTPTDEISKYRVIGEKRMIRVRELKDILNRILNKEE